eukprot:745837-Hanusia_phi.AAC.1
MTATDCYFRTPPCFSSSERGRSQQSAHAGEGRERDKKTFEVSYHKTRREEGCRRGIGKGCWGGRERGNRRGGGEEEKQEERGR